MCALKANSYFEGLPHLGDLSSLETSLRATWHRLSKPKQRFAWNLIQQLASYQTAESEHQRSNLRFLMAVQIKQLNAH